MRGCSRDRRIMLEKVADSARSAQRCHVSSESVCPIVPMSTSMLDNVAERAAHVKCLKKSTISSGPRVTTMALSGSQCRGAANAVRRRSRR